jgi:hypothetical protein
VADDPAGIEIRLLKPGDDPEAQLDLSERAFGPGSAADRDRRMPPRSWTLRTPGQVPCRAGPGLPTRTR